MVKQSAGILLYKFQNNSLYIFLIHMGGPFWARKDNGAWSIPKGEISPDEEPLQAAKREFKEETGYTINGNFKKLTPLKQSPNKIIQAWAVEGDCDANHITSNTFELEWPPKSGRMQSFPEADRAGWFTVEEAKEKIVRAQQALVDEASILLKTR